MLQDDQGVVQRSPRRGRGRTHGAAAAATSKPGKSADMLQDDQRVVQRSPMVGTRVPPPQFSVENFRTYMEEVDLWRTLEEVGEEQQGIVLWLSLPRNHPSDVKELIMARVGSEELKKATGVEKFVEAMNEAFGPTKESKEMEIYEEYYTKMKRKQEEKMSDFVNRFDKAANLAKRHKMDLPTKVKGMKLLYDAGLTDHDRKLVLTEVNFNQEEEVYKQTRSGIAKYLTDGGSRATASTKLKEPTKEEEEAMVAKGWTRPGCKQGGGRKRGRGRRQSAGSKKKKSSVHCPSCNSVRHRLADCPDSYENLRKKRKKKNEEEGYKGPNTMAEEAYV